MKVKIKLLLCIFLFVSIISCNNEEDDEYLGDWWEVSGFDGIPRSRAVGFSIGDKGYLGTGFDGDDRLNDFWEYNSEGDYWRQKAVLPGVARLDAVGFGLDGKGYIGTGSDGENELKDFYEYDPDANEWTRKADFEGDARYGAVAFAIESYGKGYIGAGYNDYSLKDFYAYTPSTDSWEPIQSLRGKKRLYASSFVIEGKAYVVSGIDNGSYLDDIWEYDPSEDYWYEKRAISNDTDESFDDDYSSIARIYGVGFTINGKGYLATGSAGSLLSTVWEYDPTTDLWEQKTSFEGTTRSQAVGFAIDNYGYVTTGVSGSYYLYDLWKFDPMAEYDEDN